MFVIKVIDGKDVRCVGYASKELASKEFRKRIATYKHENECGTLENDVSILLYGDTDCTKLFDCRKIYHKENLELNREDLIECKWAIKYFVQALKDYTGEDSTSRDLEVTLDKIERILKNDKI